MFKIGDTVQLKSGEPVMTVSMDIDSTTVQCKWFSGTKLEEGYFASNTLKAAAAP